MALIIQSLIFSGKITTIASTISTNLIISSINATVSSISNIIKYISHESNNTNEHITKFLQVTDLQFTITTIQEFINEQKVDNTHNSIVTALHGVSEILTAIHDNLQSIQAEYEQHKQKYFVSYRTFVWSRDISILECNNNILKHRYELLFELLKIYRS